jgi:hypothetical protein
MPPLIRAYFNSLVTPDFVKAPLMKSVRSDTPSLHRTPEAKRCVNIYAHQ